MTELLPSLLLAAVLASGAEESSIRPDSEQWTPLDASALAQQQWRSASPAKFASISLDANGDGSPDHASLVVNSDLKKSGIRVCYGKGRFVESETCTVIAIESNSADVMGLEKRSPGCYSYSEDDSGSPSSGSPICSRTEIIEHFRFGSSGSFFIYDRKSKTFKRYWDSD